MSVADRLRGRSDKEYHNAIIGIKLRYPASVKMEEVPINPMMTLICFSKGEALVQITATPPSGVADLDSLAQQNIYAMIQQIRPSGINPTSTGPFEIKAFRQNIDAREFTVNAQHVTFKNIILCQHRTVFNVQQILQTENAQADMDVIWTAINNTLEFFEPDIPPAPISSVIWGEFYSEEHQFGIKYPLDWSIVELTAEPSDFPQATQTLAAFSYTEKEIALSFRITSEKLPASVTLKEYARLLEYQFRKSLLILPDLTQTSLDSKPAFQFSTSPAHNVEIFRRFSVHQGRAIVLICECKNALELKLGPLIDRMMNSFQWKSHPLPENKHQYEFFPTPMELNYPSKLHFNQEMGAMLFLEYKEIPGVCFEFQVLPDDPAFNLGFSVKDIDQIIEHIKQGEAAQYSAMLISQTSVSLPSFPKPGKEIIMTGIFAPNTICKKVCRVLPMPECALIFNFIAPEEVFLKVWAEFGYSLFTDFKLL